MANNVVVCKSCGTRNRVPASPEGSAKCARCGKFLSSVVEAIVDPQPESEAVHPAPESTAYVSVTEDDRGESATLLAALVEDPRFEPRRDDLALLEAAIREGGAAEAVWRRTDLFAAFPPESTIDLSMSRPSSRSSLVVGALAGVVVFFPVFWTWLSLRQATLAYKELIASGDGEGISFLQLWTTGFDGQLATLFQLPHVAMGSVSVILLSMLLIAGDRLMTRSAEAQEVREFEDCAAQLATALTRAATIINRRTVQDPIQGLDIMAEAALKLVDAHQRTEVAALQLSKTVDLLERTTTSVMSVLESSVNAVSQSLETSMLNASNGLEAAAQGVASSLSGSTNTLTTTMDIMMSGAANSIRQAVGDAVSDLNTHVSGLSQASSELGSVAATSASAQRDLVAATSGISTSTQELDQRLQSALREFQESLAEELSKLRTQTEEISRGTENVGSSLDDHTSALQHQISELTQIRAALDRLSQGESLLVDGLTPAPAGKR